MSSLCKLLVWCFCTCLLAFRVEARWKPELAHSRRRYALGIAKHKECPTRHLVLRTDW
jgi:hypothetical protein